MRGHLPRTGLIALVLLVAALALTAVGCTGSEGPQGSVGLPGSQGSTGLPGAQGVRGEQGERGLEGATGSPGRPGSAGVPGVPGPAGPTGEDAAQSEAGISLVSQEVTLNEPLEVWGSGFRPGESITIQLEIDQFLQPVIGDTAAGTGGAFRALFTRIGADDRVASRIVLGNVYTLIAVGGDGSRASVPVMIVPERPPTPTPTPSPTPTPVPPAPSPSTSLVAAKTISGAETIVWGSGFRPFENVVLSVVGGPDILVARQANASGALTVEVFIDLDPGIYTMLATGDMGSEATAPLLIVVEK